MGFNKLGIVYAQGYLFLAVYYISNGPTTTNSNEIYFMKIDPLTGARVDSCELHTTNPTFSLSLGYFESTDYIVISRSYLYYNVLFLANIGVNPMVLNT